ncbi:DUF3883 domain-containing protein [Plantactinospora sp. S1510]|uniref:DUF3883 domain-containing protein n=1 Tax=Plantactinospora alkalitolerans TaxID=2789879 RepID=A0ABS0H2D1_9ACTN|nr:DUF3883 domain-containing protein [Plantactinospora alkalitolerans]MBF9132622.1 DUF3883 domain-containing protein [Plantactinospora alkalitolerans]
MEITNRVDLGADLHAPQVNDKGGEEWSYALVAAVRPGDIVLHWHKWLAGYRGIVGYSVAASGPYEDQIIWASRGTYGRTRPSGGPEASWRYELTDYTRIAGLDQDRFRVLEPELRRVKADLESRYSGALYFPFAFSDKRPVRAAQGYLVKFPAAIVAAVPELLALPKPVADARPDQRSTVDETKSARRKRSGSGKLADTPLRLAIERHAVDWTMTYYARLGYDVKDVGTTKSYDVHATQTGEERHIEVKGSTGLANAVELTANEVNHGRTDITDLVVVDQIQWRRLPDGKVETHGGHARRWATWSPLDTHLRATRYHYELPPHFEEHDIE